MRILPGNAQHIGARHSQQDSFGFADPDDAAFIAHGGFLAVVCDGMGGMEYGDAAGRTAVRAFLDAYQRKTFAESIPDALERSVREANSQVVALAHSLGLAEGIGTTLIAVAFTEHSIYYVSVGDSGIFHCSGGQCRMINRPHVFATILDAAVARGSLSREDAESHPERESLTSYIGTESLEEIDRNVEPLPLGADDTILLASDGLFKTLDPDEIRASLQGEPQSWPELLVERTLAKKREFQDNVTVLSVTLETDEHAAMTRSTVVMMPAPPPSIEAALPPPVAAAAAAVAVVPPPLPPPVASGPPPAWTPPVDAAPPPQAARRGLWPLMVALLVFGAGIAGWWYTRHHSIGDLMRAPTLNDPGRKGSGSPSSPDVRTPDDPTAPAPPSPSEPPKEQSKDTPVPPKK
jgi:serine/threonine protein phosphatase PrpC